MDGQRDRVSGIEIGDVPEKLTVKDWKRFFRRVHRRPRTRIRYETPHRLYRRGVWRQPRVSQHSPSAPLDTLTQRIAIARSPASLASANPFMVRCRRDIAQVLRYRARSRLSRFPSPVPRCSPWVNTTVFPPARFLDRGPDKAFVLFAQFKSDLSDATYSPNDTLRDNSSRHHRMERG